MVPTVAALPSSMETTAPSRTFLNAASSRAASTMRSHERVLLLDEAEARQLGGGGGASGSRPPQLATAQLQVSGGSFVRAHEGDGFARFHERGEEVDAILEPAAAAARAEKSEPGYEILDGLHVRQCRGHDPLLGSAAGRLLGHRRERPPRPCPLARSRNRIRNAAARSWPMPSGVYHAGSRAGIAEARSRGVPA